MQSNYSSIFFEEQASSPKLSLARYNLVLLYFISLLSSLMNFFPKLIPPQSRMSCDFYLEKKGQKPPSHAKLLACGFTFMQGLGLHAVACKSVFNMLCHKKQQQEADFFICEGTSTSN
jgi:hypothetical protein